MITDNFQDGNFSVSGKCISEVLKKLEIDFLGTFNFSLSQLTSSSLLPCLEHLSLRNHGTTWDGLTRHRNQFDPASIFYHSVLSVIGKCCPVLTTLEVKGFGTMKEDPLKLILKDFLKMSGFEIHCVDTHMYIGM